MWSYYPLVANSTRVLFQRDAGVSRDDSCSLFGNDEGFGPCDWDPDSACRGSTREQCICSGVSYLVWAACDACDSPPLDTSWDDYSHTDDFDCTGLPQQFPRPFPTGSDAVPSWALAMASATPTPTIFDLDAASSFVESPNPIPSSTTVTEQTSTTSTTALTTSPPTSQITTKPLSQSTVPPTDGSRSPASFPSIVPSHSRNISGSQSTVNALSSIASSSTGGNIAPTSIGAQQPLSASRSTLNKAAIIGIVIGVFFGIALVVLILWLFSRRRRRQAARSSSPFIGSPVDHDSPASTTSAVDAIPDASNLNTALPQRLETVPDLGDTASNIEKPLRPLRRTPGLSISTARSTSTDSTAMDSDMRSQLREVTARVRELEAQLEGPRALAPRPRTPPPGYTGE
ncbi:hypothetical protein C8R47DRAFT_1155055 [Mycena vitilis]|nr:hypothetical protein C8R47DRAFT_1165426 [Mycena vitilis]KAJ6465559.1 hypothetical protein C8R47DRAFT_1155055 [Mycena vitilis]